MGCSGLIFIVFHVVLSISLATAQTHCYDDRGNFTSNSTYAKNLNLILSSLYSNVHSREGLFYSTTMGEAPDTVYAHALCRADSTKEACTNCVNLTAQDMINKCPNRKEAVSWGVTDPPCIVRYSSTPIFGILYSTPTLSGYNTGNLTSNRDEFNQIWVNMMDSLVNKAGMGSTSLKFASGERKAPDFKTIFALMQCTPDLSQTDCITCLGISVSYYQNCCHGHVGGFAIQPSCLFRWDLYPFYGATPQSPPPVSPPPLSPPLSPNTTHTQDKGGNTYQTALIISVPVIILIIIISLTYVLCRSRREAIKTVEEAICEQAETLRFGLSTIIAATNNFSDANKLGQGGFGSVYKGKLPNGQYIAVKRLVGCSSQGETEFKNEIVLMARLQHKNLVSFLGFCLEGEERLLILEFVANSSLDRFIFDPIKRTQLNWEMRYKIISGIARGMLYLHEESQIKIIHRDLKPSNVLLDGEMQPKISDFGTARLFVLDQSNETTRNVAGTYGYIAPEYAKYGTFSAKSDVFSFGVMVLEIVSGKKNTCFDNSDNMEHLLTNAWKNWNEGTPLKLMDSTLTRVSKLEMISCIHIALLCVQENVARRPTMASVVLKLNSESISLPIPTRPGLMMENMEQETPLREHNNSGITDPRINDSLPNLSRNEASITEPYPR